MAECAGGQDDDEPDEERRRYPGRSAKDMRCEAGDGDPGHDSEREGAVIYEQSPNFERNGFQEAHYGRLYRIAAGRGAGRALKEGVP